MNADLQKELQKLLESNRYQVVIKRLNHHLGDDSNDVQALNLRAYSLFKLGDTVEAETDIHAILELQPDNLRALKTLAEIEYSRANSDKFIELSKQILIQESSDNDLRYRLIELLVKANLNNEAIDHYSILFQSGNHSLDKYTEYAQLLASQGQIEDAVNIYQQVIEIEGCPQNTRIDFVNLLQNNGYFEKAVPIYRSLIKELPDLLGLYQNLAVALQKLGQHQEALQVYDQVLKFAPNYIDGLIGSANIYSDLRKYSEAEKLFLRAVEADKTLFAAHFNLANTYQALGKPNLAIQYFQNAIEINPNYAGCYNNLGNVLKGLGRSSEARKVFEKALALDPSISMVHSNLGALYCDAGMMDLSLKHYEKALEISPDNVDAFTNYLYFLNYLGAYDDKEIYQKHLEWSERFNPKLEPYFQLDNNQLKLDRPLRIGYVSADFKRHSVAYFFQPLLEAHNRTDFEIFCYANNKYEDTVTLELKESSDHWRDIRSLEDEAVARLVANDGIDILVDLAGHTDGNRLRIFTFKPAPIQISWLGYPNTTGVKQMDYRLTDQVCDPDGETDDVHSERLIRLDTGFLCYRGDQSVALTKELSCTKKGYVTFGSFNNITKITPEVKLLWSEILKKTVNSKFLLKSKLFVDPEISEALYTDFESLGIPRERIDLRSYVNSYEEHMKVYDDIDIALDTFPYNGTTTTCEALWMGVPVITLTAPNHRSRVSASLLSRIDYQDWIASSGDEYIAKAVDLAMSSIQLNEARANLRSRMVSSDLCNEQKFALTIESAYQEMWRNFILSGTAR